MRFRNAVILVPALVAFGCSAPAADTAEKASAEDVAAVRQAIEAVNGQFTAAAKAGDAAAVAGFYTADALAMQPNAPSAQGTEAIKAMFQGMVDAVTLTEFTLTTQEVSVNGDEAVEVGVYNMTIQPKQAGAPAAPDKGKFIVIWKKQADGSWKLHRDIWNSDSAPAPAH